jgi:lysozyme
MRPSNNCYDIIKRFELLVLTAYRDKAGFWTIGYGNKFYANGKPVAIGDTITRSRAERLLKCVVNDFAWYINKLLLVEINQFQFDALVSFAYDVGIDLDEDTLSEDFCQLTLLDMINENPADPLIRGEFLRWNKIAVDGRKMIHPELDIKRRAQADLYFTYVNGVHVGPS